MIIWLASYPRSGNTFLRIVIERLYRRGSSTVYPHDGVLERLGEGLLATADVGASLTDLRTSGDVHFVKTHRRRSFDVTDADCALYLARDGRDALTSFARQRAEGAPDRFADELRVLIDRHDGGTASWGQNVLSWLSPVQVGEPAPRIVLVRFEDLIRDPAGSVSTAIKEIAPSLTMHSDAELPAFEALHARDPAFFRRGRTGTHRDELPAELEQLFWSYEDNRDAMARLGYR